MTTELVARPSLAPAVRDLCQAHLRCLAEVRLIPMGGDRFFVDGPTGAARERLLLAALEASRALDNLLATLEAQLLVVVPAAQAEGMTLTAVAEAMGVTRQAATTMVDHASAAYVDAGYKHFDSISETAFWRRTVRQRTSHGVGMPNDTLIDLDEADRLLEALERLRLFQVNGAWMIEGPTPIERVASLLAAMHAISRLTAMVAQAQDRLVRVARSIGIGLAAIGDKVGISPQAVAKRLQSRDTEFSEMIQSVKSRLDEESEPYGSDEEDPFLKAFKRAGDGSRTDKPSAEEASPAGVPARRR